MKDYDVAVVGSGPVGSTLARYMADEGYKVVILEKKRNVGVPLQCAGLLGKRIKKINILPQEFIMNEVYGAYLHSPSEIVLKVSKKHPEAYVIDRVAYDKYLSDRAVDSGAQLLLKHRVDNVDIHNGDVLVRNGEKISAQVVVGADGYNSRVSKLFNPASENYEAVQFLMSVKDEVDTDYVHLNAESKITPGFSWIIPISESLLRVGLFSTLSYKEASTHLEAYIKKNPQLKNSAFIKKYHGCIPIYNPKKQIVKNRTLLLGDAASQVKPTTGGGLTLGFLCAKLASEVMIKALEEENMEILQEYQVLYGKKFGRELKTQRMVHKTFKSLSDADLDFMFSKLKEEGAEEIISEYGDMDTQSPLVMEMLRRGIIFSILPQMLSRRISSLWK
ncbi:NAD(P)/FAD-dependent oxidoreductase [Methanobacterium sp. CWC-01]|uniref:geranylgeranyl reductase family protein n=1 Tax=Methanobacterium aridiramus TaxID=2584467 RepID=UPI0025786995|nr:NAD(P)/FAD-dependent oxidoreductase [Methanobacterium sp. CWC-01]WJI09244.1 NAD(P)/FAD-dependent oxidoreductase [Methanobacterium sp. CWC-01]